VNKHNTKVFLDFYVVFKQFEGVISLKSNTKMHKYKRQERMGSLHSYHRVPGYPENTIYDPLDNDTLIKFIEFIPLSTGFKHTPGSK
jgi:hypothetical protein